MSTCNYTVSVVSSVLFIVLGCAIQLKYFHKARYSNAQFQGHREHLLKTDGTRPRNTVRPLNGETPCTGPVYSCSGRCPTLCGLPPLWSLGSWPSVVRLRRPLRAWGASRCCAPFFRVWRLCGGWVRRFRLRVGVVAQPCAFCLLALGPRTMLRLERKKNVLLS